MNFNGADDTLECLESLLRLNQLPRRIVIVDNASSQDSVDKIAGWAAQTQTAKRDHPLWSSALAGPRKVQPTFSTIQAASMGETEPDALITLIKSPINLGFAGANNIGIDFASRDKDCARFWILNNDTIVDPDSLLELEARMAHDSHIGMCGSTLVYYDDPSTVQACGGRFNSITGRGTPIGSRLPVAQLDALGDVEADMDYAIGASMLISREFYLTVGPMAEDYFLYFEELDWATRAGNLFSLGWARRSIVYHKEGGSIGTSLRTRPSNTALYYQAIGLFRFNRKFRPAVLPLTFLRTALLALRFGLKRDADGARIMRLAIADFVGKRRRVGPIVLSQM